MNFIKFILAILGLIFGVMLFFWLFGLITSLIWYGFWIGLLAAVGYGGYKLFKKAENKYVGERIDGRLHRRARFQPVVGRVRSRNI